MVIKLNVKFSDIKVFGELFIIIVVVKLIVIILVLSSNNLVGIILISIIDSSNLKIEVF